VHIKKNIFLKKKKELEIKSNVCVCAYEYNFLNRRSLIYVVKIIAVNERIWIKQKEKTKKSP
jgi:hypothetical protein